MAELFIPSKTPKIDHTVRRRRSSKRATVIGCHGPPRDVSMPRSLSAAAIFRVDRCRLAVELLQAAAENRTSALELEAASRPACSFVG
jgi:hypothetical protein